MMSEILPPLQPPRMIATSSPSPIDSSLSVRFHCPPYHSSPKNDHAPVSEPPAWRLNYTIGTGACGSVFLENVHIFGMEFFELWAVKRISQGLQNFNFKRYEAEINNLQALAKVSFVETCIVS